MYVELAFIIVLIIIVLLFGVREGVSFYETSDVYFNLKLTDDQINKITEEAQAIKFWQEYPDFKTREGNWYVFPLQAFGKWSSKNSKQCNKTHNAISQIPKTVTIQFVKLDPSTTVLRHQEWGELSNHVLRNVMLLSEGQANIWVAGQQKPLQYKKWITYDSSKLHSFNNKDSQPAYLLVVDIERPEKIIKGKSKVQISNELESFISGL